MTRQEAAQYCRDELNRYGLNEWGVRINPDINQAYVGMCSHKDKVIILNAHHIDTHPGAEVKDTILHEVAHALTPGHGHDKVWGDKAMELGCLNTSPSCSMALDPRVIDAIRSGATVEVTFVEETVTKLVKIEETVRRPKYNITRLQDKCEYCGKVAKTAKETLIENNDDNRPNLKVITLECGHTIIKKIPKGTPFHLFQMGGDPSCQHEWNKNSCTKCDRKRPYQFQIEGMQFLEMALAVNMGGACFDEMGLGKTIQAEGVIKYHPELWPTLWVVKSGLKFQFAKSIVLWMGDEHVPQIIEKSGDFLIPGLKHYIVGYDMLVPKVRKGKNGKDIHQGFDITKFDTIGIKCVVLDECQQIKNPDSTRTQQVRKIVRGKKVIPLSGTPWKNRGSELFPVFNMMDPQKFYSGEHFKRTWVNTYMHGNRVMEGGIRNPEKFREFTKDLCIRRERHEVMSELPLVNRTKLYVKMDTQQEQIYDEAVEAFVQWYEQQAENIAGMHILAAMAKMRHLVALAKMPSTVEYVEEFIEDTDRKLVVFVHHQDVGVMMYDELKEKFGTEMPILKLTSAMNGEDRFNAQELFNRSPRAIMIASTLAAGEGLNLQTCADCVLHERQWNPANEEQAEGRFIRIGQTAISVNAIYTHMTGLTAIDDKLDGIIERKRVSFHNTMNKGELPVWNENSMAKELAESIVNGFRKKKGIKKAS